MDTREKDTGILGDYEGRSGQIRLSYLVGVRSSDIGEYRIAVSCSDCPILEDNHEYVVTLSGAETVGAVVRAIETHRDEIHPDAVFGIGQVSVAQITQAPDLARQEEPHVPQQVATAENTQHVA